MEIRIPETFGNEPVRVRGTVGAILEQIFVGTSKTGKPKATVSYVITEAIAVENGADSIEGGVVLETFSLQPKALFRLNDLYKQVTGVNLPHGSYSKEELEDMLNEALSGTDWTLQLDLRVPEGGTEERCEVISRTHRQR